LYSTCRSEVEKSSFYLSQLGQCEYKVLDIFLLRWRSGQEGVCRGVQNLSDEATVTSYAAQKSLRYVEALAVEFPGFVRLHSIS
jgi:hypothetical protein